jgi:DNA-binding transcriptional LysR family regulator
MPLLRQQRRNVQATKHNDAVRLSEVRPADRAAARAMSRCTETAELFEREVNGALSCDSNDVIVDAGLAGTGLVQLHTYMAEPHLRSGQLVQVLTDYAAMGPPISVLFPSNRHLAPKVRVFIDFVADILRRDEENGLVDVPDWPLAANVA